jgi:transcriptional regulator with XRE-family HTH domain
MYNYSKLRGKIAEVCGTQDKFAEQLNVAARTLSQKLHNMTDFKQSEIEKAVELLGIPMEDISLYFFTHEVPKCEQTARGCK